MKKFILTTILILSALSIIVYFWFPAYMTDLIAKTIVSESLPAYIPKRIQNKIEALTKPLNKGTETMLQKMHASDISLDQILQVVDNTSEEQAYALLDDLNKTKPSNTNGVFDVAREHIKTDFDVEIFRKPFNQHLQMKQIKKAMAFANRNRKTNDVDFATAKAILKKILIQKEKEFRNTSKR